MDVTSVTQTFINRLVWDNGYTKLVGKPTRVDSLLDMCLVRHEGELITCETLQEISDHCGVLLDVEWGGHCRETQEKRCIFVYHKTNLLGLQNFLRGQIANMGKGSCVEGISKNFKDIIF